MSSSSKRKELEAEEEQKKEKEKELVKLLESLEEIDCLIVAKVGEFRDLQEGEPNQPLILKKQKERYELEQKEDSLWKKKEELEETMEEKHKEEVIQQFEEKLAKELQEKMEKNHQEEVIEQFGEKSAKKRKTDEEHKARSTRMRHM